jgi:hypothetical protein
MPPNAPGVRKHNVSITANRPIAITIPTTIESLEKNIPNTTIVLPTSNIIPQISEKQTRRNIERDRINAAKFEANPSVNPETGYHIKINGPTYKMLEFKYRKNYITLVNRIPYGKVSQKQRGDRVEVSRAIQNIIGRYVNLGIPIDREELPNIDQVNTFEQKELISNNNPRILYQITRRDKPLISMISYAFIGHNDNFPLPSAKAFIRYLESQTLDNDTLRFSIIGNATMVGGTKRGLTIPIDINKSIPLVRQLAEYGLIIEDDNIVYDHNLDLSKFIDTIATGSYGDEEDFTSAILNKSDFVITRWNMVGGAIIDRGYKYQRKNEVIKDGLSCLRVKVQDGNNCLIECILLALDSKELANSVRHNCGFEENVQLGRDNDIRALENYFGKSIGVCVGTNLEYAQLSNGDRNNLSWGNLRLFNTSVSRVNIYRKSDNGHDRCGSDNSDIIVYLKNGHYYLVRKEFPILDKYCKISGAKLYSYENIRRGSGSQKTIVGELSRQGRLDKKKYHG